jgi:DNA topoisomerase-1
MPHTLSTSGSHNDCVGQDSVSVDPIQSAREAGLRYVSDEGPGIRRKRAGKGFSYIGPDGEVLRDAKQLQRIRSLAIPPAWTDVWIAPTPRGHIQATGRDAKGRKQYRYHPAWRAVRDATKYHRMIAFAEALPRLRERVLRDMALPGLPREKVLATVVRLLDETDIRVGNQEYARENESFGLTTLQNQHVEVAGSTLRFQFKGKSGKEHVIEVRDRRVAKIVRRCEELPGQELFQYLDDGGQRRLVESSDVNQYLREVTGQEFTAKDFRTWAGTVVAAHTLRETGAAETKTELKQNINTAVKTAAQRLGNTPTICRKCYVHPSVLDAYEDGSLLTSEIGRRERRMIGAEDGLAVEEAEVLAFLRRMEREAAESATSKAG